MHTSDDGTFYGRKLEILSSNVPHPILNGTQVITPQQVRGHVFSVGVTYESDTLPKHRMYEDRVRKKDESGKTPGPISSHSFHCH